MPKIGKSAKPHRSRALLTACALVGVGTAISGCATSKMIANAEQICKDWRAISVSKSDSLTQETAAQIEAGNVAREVWGCVT